MTPLCAHERAVVAAVHAGRWPDEADEALRAHVAGCVDCGEAATIAQVLLEADRAVDVPVPSAAQVWWRLAVRARLEREQAAARPVVWWQGIAAACAVGLGVAWLGQLGPRLAAALTSVAGEVADGLRVAVPTLGWPDVPLALPVPAMVVVAGAALVVLGASAAVYLWVAED